MKISVLYLGHIRCKKDELSQCKDPSAMIKSPISAVLIEHPVLGNVLYDTGNSPFYRTEYSEEMRTTYPIPEFISIADALEQKGLTVNDIDMIILSHMHFDHAGGLKYFAGTKAIKNVVVAEEELKNAFFQVTAGQGGAYIRDTFDLKDIVFRPVKSDKKIMDDVSLFIQKAHTPGVIGLILSTKAKGTVIATSDSIYTREAYEEGLAPGGPINKTKKDFFDNLSRVKEMQKKYRAELLFGHDYDQITAWSKEGTFE